MQYANSIDFFEISKNVHLDNNLQARLLCLKDFLKKCLFLPFALSLKACKTVFRILGVIFAANFVLLTLGSSASARNLFVKGMSGLAKDLADWILLPLAIVSSFFRLLMAFLFHPNFYFNSLA